MHHYRYMSYQHDLNHIKLIYTGNYSVIETESSKRQAQVDRKHIYKLDINSGYKHLLLKTGSNREVQ